MKNIHFRFSSIIIIAVVFLINGCKNDQPPPQQQQQIVCPLGLQPSVCNNPSALHGQIMMHNMTDKSYDVTVYTHDGKEGVENHHLMPGKGWTFIGVLQGDRMIIAKPLSEGETYESHVMVTGGMQYIMNITHFGLTKVHM